jgi:hypothetical protein
MIVAGAVAPVAVAPSSLIGLCVKISMIDRLPRPRYIAGS